MSEAGDIWNVLGIERTSDARLIRRAYVAKLRNIDPDTDAAAFMVLRNAFELAMGAVQTNLPERNAFDELKREAGKNDQDNEDVAGIKNFVRKPPEQDVEGKRREEWQVDLREMTQRQSALRSALVVEDAVKAWEMYNQAMARGDISLDQQTNLALLVMQKVVDDKSISQSIFMNIMKSLALDDALARYENKAVLSGQIKQRIAAYHWLNGLREKSLQRARGLQRYDVRAAQIFLHKRKWLGRHHSLLVTMQTVFGEYKTHRVWLVGELDSVWLGELEARVQGRVKSNRRNGKIIGVFFMALIGGDVAYVTLRAFYNYLRTLF